MLGNGFEDDIKNCIEVLEKGGVILYPTETVWGLGCDALNKDAVDKIYSLKRRPVEKSMIVLLADARDVLQYVAAPPPDIISIIGDFERPTTVIYENALGFPDNVAGQYGSLAIRVTTDAFCRALVKRYRKPIVSTSANISGDKTPSIFNEISTAIKTGVDYVVKYRQEDTTINPPSKLIKLSDEGVETVIRG